MRKILGALGLSSALIFTLAVHAAAPANFAGTWTLDKSKSQGLNPRIQNAESVTWTITQDGKALTVEEKVTGGQMGGGPGGAAPAGAPPAGGPPPGGGGGGGGGRGGMMGSPPGPRTYNLDGTETTSEMGSTKIARKATWSADQSTLELVSKSTGQRDGQEFVITTTEKFSVSADGKTLTVTRKVEGPRPSDATYVFTK